MRDSGKPFAPPVGKLHFLFSHESIFHAKRRVSQAGRVAFDGGLFRLNGPLGYRSKVINIIDEIWQQQRPKNGPSFSVNPLDKYFYLA